MYRNWQEDFSRFQVAKSGRRLAQLKPEYFEFLWYVYNRGGVCNVSTVELWYKVSIPCCRLRLRELVADGWLTQLFSPSVYQKKDRLGQQPLMYRVSTKLLACVGNPDSNIRKLKIKQKAVATLGITNFFLKPDQRDYRIVNRRDRTDFLIKQCAISPDVFPKYFVGHQQAVTSLNHEIVCKEDDVFIVWYPQTDFGGDFFSFAKKWSGVFKATEKIQCLAISTNQATQRMLNQIEPEIEKTRKLTKIEAYQLEKARSRGLLPTKSNKRKIPFNFTVVHYPDAWETYTDHGGLKT